MNYQTLYQSFSKDESENVMSNILGDLTFADLEKTHKNSNVKLPANTKEVRIVKTFCEIPKGKNTLRFALVKFGKYERYDIRNWYENATKPGKGMSFTFEEIEIVRDSLRNFSSNTNGLTKRAECKNEKFNVLIYDRICLFSEYTIGGVEWNKELALVDFGYGKKFDFRKWSKDYTICGKGISVSFSDMEKIQSVLASI